MGGTVDGGKGDGGAGRTDFIQEKGAAILREHRVRPERLQGAAEEARM